MKLGVKGQDLGFPPNPQCSPCTRAIIIQAPAALVGLAVHEVGRTSNNKFTASFLAFACKVSYVYNLLYYINIILFSMTREKGAYNHY